jgi:hypothetical protein
MGGKFKPMMGAHWELEIAEHSIVDSLEKQVIISRMEVDGSVQINKRRKFREHFL